ncbi:hypothetical protein GCM10010336_61860 [Streptomyces goshikiensis]|nr:hypothetical protein GCM10010336_61860 [Streptomyces goshikiensis]
MPVLTDSVDVVAGEVTRHTDQPRCVPEHLGRGVNPELVADQAPEGIPVEDQPRHIEQALVDDARIRAALVLGDHRCAVLVDAQRIDPTAVHRSGAVLARQ